MERLDQTLGSDPFIVDETACYAAAQAIKNYRATTHRLPWSKYDAATQLAFKIFFVSICHQMNWDFLQGRMAEKFLRSDPKEMIENALSATPEYIRQLIGDYGKPERVQAAKRASILRETAKVFVEELGNNPMSLVVSAQHRITGPSGILVQLDVFDAYREDPLRKKSNVLVQDLVRERIIEFSDQNDVEPAIDYHLIRLYLRTGRVIAKYPVVNRTLKSPTAGKDVRLKFVSLLRAEVATALRHTAFFSKLSIAEVNYIEWQVGRSRCHSENPNCESLIESVDLDEDIAALLGEECPYKEFCLSYSNSAFQLHEPTLKKNFY